MKPPRGSTIDRSHSLARGLKGYWLFNEGTGGAAYDISGNNLTCTLKNIEPDTDWISTEHGHAVNMDGVDEYGTLGDVLNMGGKSMTLMVKFKMDSLPISGDEYGLFVRASFSTGRKDYLLDIFDNGAVKFYTYNTEWTGLNGASGDTSINTIHDVVVTFENADKRATVYVDGVQTETGILSQQLGDNGGNVDTFFGGIQNPAFDDYFDGNFIESGIWERALSADEILWQYEDPYDFVKEVTIEPRFFIQPTSAVSFFPFKNYMRPLLVR